MRMSKKTVGRFLVAASLCTASVQAQPLGSEEQDDFVDEEAEPAEELVQKTDAEDELSGPPEPDPLAAEEEEWPDLQLFVGARYRMLVVPQALIQAFGVDGGKDFLLHGVGVELGISQKNFELVFSPWFVDYGFDDVPFKGVNDNHESWEFIQSNLKALYLTVDLLWRFNFSRSVSWTLGGGAGIGLVLGDLTRTEAYWGEGTSPTSPRDPHANLQRCPNPPVSAVAPALNGGVPNQQECPADGSYGKQDPWPVYPWVSVQTGVRYQPVRNFIGRLDLGVSTSGLWVGLGADYGL